MTNLCQQWHYSNNNIGNLNQSCLRPAVNKLLGVKLKRVFIANKLRLLQIPAPLNHRCYPYKYKNLSAYNKFGSLRCSADPPRRGQVALLYIHHNMDSQWIY